MKKIRLLAAMAGAAVFLSACQSADVDTTTIIVEKKGNVVEAIVEDFGESYYDATELETVVNSEIDDYNAKAGAKPVAMDSFEMDSDKAQVKVKISYASSQDYTQMNERELFCGTVSEAYDAGYQFPDMTSADGAGTVSAADVLEQGSKHMVISEEKLNIQVPGKITYVSSGVTIADKKTATLPDDGENLSYIIYE